MLVEDKAFGARTPLEADFEQVQSVLRNGAERAREEARRTLKRARRAMGLE